MIVIKVEDAVRVESGLLYIESFTEQPEDSRVIRISQMLRVKSPGILDATSFGTSKFNKINGAKLLVASTCDEVASLLDYTWSCCQIWCGGGDKCRLDC